MPARISYFHQVAPLPAGGRVNAIPLLTPKRPLFRPGTAPELVEIEAAPAQRASARVRPKAHAAADRETAAIGVETVLNLQLAQPATPRHAFRPSRQDVAGLPNPATTPTVPQARAPRLPDLAPAMRALPGEMPQRPAVGPVPPRAPNHSIMMPAALPRADRGEAPAPARMERILQTVFEPAPAIRPADHALAPDVPPPAPAAAAPTAPAPPRPAPPLLAPAPAVRPATPPPSRGVQIGTLEVRVVTPPPTQAASAAARAMAPVTHPPAARPARIARGFGVFGFGQS